MVPRFRPRLRWSDIARSVWGEGCGFSELESQFARSFGFAHAVWFPYARVAVQAYLEELPRRGQVVLSAFNCTALGAAVVAAGQTPAYVDTQSGGYAEDPTRFAEALGASSTVAGIAVAPWGIPAHSYDCAKPILYDYALGTLQPRPRGLKSGDGVVYSLGWGKPLSAYRGGMLCTDETSLATQWRARRDLALVDATPKQNARDVLRLVALRLGFDPLFFGFAAQWAARTPLARALLGTESIGMPADSQAALSPRLWVLAKRRLGERARLRALRLEQVRTYDALLRNLPEARGALPPLEPLSHYPLLWEGRDELHTWLARHGIFTSSGLFDRLLCDYAPLRGVTLGGLENARTLTQKTLHLPLFFDLSAQDQERIARYIRQGQYRNRATTYLGKSHAASGTSGS